MTDLPPPRCLSCKRPILRVDADSRHVWCPGCGFTVTGEEIARAKAEAVYGAGWWLEQAREHREKRP